MTPLEEAVRAVICKDCSQKPLEQVRSLKEIEQKLRSFDKEEIEEIDKYRIRVLEWVLFKREEL